MNTRYILLFICCLSISLSFGYDYDKHKNKVTDTRLKLIVLAAPDAPKKKATRRAVLTLKSAVASMKRFQVISPGNLPAYKDRTLDWAKSTGATEALTISVIDHKQEKIKKIEYYTKETQSKKHKDNNGKRTKKISYTFSYSARFSLNKIDLKTGTIIKSLQFERIGRGDTRESSSENLYSSLSSNLKGYLRSLYLMETEIIKVFFDRLVLRLGTNMGIRKGDIFKIRTRGRTEFVGEKEYEFTGDVVALARITEVGQDACVAHLIRRWDFIDINYQAVESTKRPGGMRFSADYTPLYKHFGGAFHFLFNPLGQFNFLLGLGLAAGRDSRDDMNLMGWSFQTSLNYRIPVAHTFRLKPGLGYTLVALARADDESESVYTALHKIPIIMDTEWVLSKHWNLNVGLAWDLFGTNDSWYKGSDDSKKSADWDSGSKIPRADNSGLRLTMSLDYLSF
ncbi:MAG: hypothetical protein HQK83_00440 [Fibrobacteria bacterium]|nr:hypothetical protein [Fibrobacteria bacterium]